MADVYVLYSKKLDKYYIGSCLDLKERLTEHLSKKFEGGYTSRSDDWELIFAINNLEYKQARRIEAHIKKMKSRKYIEDLKRYPEMVNRLIEKYK